MTPRAAWVVFVASLVAAIAIRIYLVIALPYGHAIHRRLEGLNDEPSHLSYIRALAEGRGFQVQTHNAMEPGAFDRADFEYYQPPLYYLLCAPVVALVNEPAELPACRAISFVLGLLSLFVLSRVLDRLGCSTFARRLGVAFLALLPVHAYFTSAVSNDALTWLISLLLTHQVLTLLTGVGWSASRERPWIHLRLAVLLGLGLLTKSSIIIFAPVIAAAYAYIAWTSRRSAYVWSGLGAIALGLAIAAPWYARNLIVYGSVFALEVGFGPPLPARSSVASIAQTFIGTSRYFWMPMSHVPGGTLVHDVRVLGGGVLLLYGAATLATVRRAWRDPGIAMLALLMLLAIGAHLRLNLIWAEAEGRFMLPAAASVVYFFVEPTLRFFGRFRHGEALAWAWLTLLALHPYILLAYAG